MAESEELIDRADALATEGRWDEALEAYQQVLEQDPDRVEVRQQVINIAFKKGDYPEVINQYMELAEMEASQGDEEAAVQCYHEILRLEESVHKKGIALRGGTEDVAQIQNLVGRVKPEIFFRCGRFCLERGRLDEALHYLRSSLDLQPGRWDTHMALGRAYMQKGMDKEAIGEFQEVVRLAPKEAAQAYEMLGEVFLRAGRPPQTTVVWFRNAGELYMQNQQHAEAIRTYQRILEFEPQNKDVLGLLGKIYEDQGYVAEAARTYAVLAEIYTREGLLDKVIHYYQKLLDCDPGNEEARERVIEIYRNILKRDPSNISVRLRLIENLLLRGLSDEAGEHQLSVGRAYLERGNLDDAVVVTRKLLELDPENVEARKLMGEIYRKKDMGSEALAEFQQVVRLYRERGEEEAALAYQQQLVEWFPEASELAYQVALELRNKGDHEGALRELNRIVSENPGDVVARVYAAEELVALDRWDEAVEAYRRVLELDPGRLDVRRKLIAHFLEAGNLDEAAGEILNLPPEDFERSPLMHRLIEARLQVGDLARAEEETNQLPDEDDRKLLYRIELINRHLESGDLEKAAEAIPRIPRSYRGRNKLVTRLLEAHLASGALDGVTRILSQLPADDQLRHSFQRRLIASYLEAGRFEEARSAIAHLDEADEARAGFVNQLISGYLEAGELQQAAREIKTLAEGNPARNSFMGRLIEAYLSTGDIDSAVKEVATLSADDEIRPRYHRRIIQAYLNAGRLPEAEESLLALDDSDPEKRSFLRLLIQKYETLGRLDRVRELVMQMPDDMFEEKQQYLEGLVHNFLDAGDRQQILQMAESYASQGDHQEAERLYREILAYHPADVETRLRLSEVVAARGDLERAREGMLVLAGRFHREGNATSAADIYNRLLKIDPDNLNARYRLGQLWAQQGQSAQALEKFSELARVYLDQNLPEVAQRVLTRILELDPKDVIHRREAIKLAVRNLRFSEATEHYRVLLEIYLERGDLVEAKTCVEEITNLQPLNLELRKDLGEMFLRAGFLEEGQGLLEDLTATYRSRGERDHALGVLRTLIRCFDENKQWETALEYRIRLADELVEVGRWQEAQGEYVEGIEQYLLRGREDRVPPLFAKLIDGFFRYEAVPEGVAALEGMAERLSDAGSPHRALQVKDRVAGVMERLEEWDRAAELVADIASRYLELGDPERSLAFRRKAADMCREHGREEEAREHLFEMARLQLDRKGYDAARPVLEELRRSASGDAAYLERLGELLFTHGLFSEARPLYDEVLAVQPGRAESLSRIAIIYAREGMLVEAADVARQIFSKGLISRIIEEYKQATGYTPGDAASHIRLGQFYRQLGFLEEAIREFQRAARDPGKLLHASNQLALCFKEKGYVDLAIRQLQKALDQPGYDDEEQLETRYILAEALQEQGLYEQALQAFHECYAVDIRYRDVARRIEGLTEKIEGGEEGKGGDVVPFERERE